MLGYATIGTNDLPRTLAFYDALLAEVGAKRLMETPHGFTMYGVTLRKPALAITPPYNGKPATPAQQSTRFTKRLWSLAALMRARPGFEARMDQALSMRPIFATRKETKFASIGSGRNSSQTTQSKDRRLTQTPAESRLLRAARLPPASLPSPRRAGRPRSP
jgi:hypothetical protein